MNHFAARARRITALISIFLAAACRPTPAQQPAGTLLPDGALSGSFGQPSAVVELAPGKVAFADSKDRRFLFGDFGSGSVSAAGRHADTISATSPAGDHKLPGWVASIGGGQVALVDFAALRTTTWNAAGQPVRVLALPAVGGATPVLTYDSLGHGYKIDYQSIVGGNEPGSPVRPDSIPLLRIDLGSGKVDTVARISAPEYGEARFGDQTQTVAKIFAPVDLFGVLPDGSLWVARGRSNSVDWRDAGGRWSRGTGRQYTPAPVTQADRDRVMARLKASGLPAVEPIVFPFAETKPPFEAALTRPTGEVWLQRPRASDDAPLVYDVVGRDGKWKREIAAPTGVLLLGFGQGDVVYGGKKNASGGRTVERYRVKEL